MSDQTTESLPPDVQTLLLMLVEGWSPEYVDTYRIESLRRGELDLSQFASGMQLTGDRLVLVLNHHAAVPNVFDAAFEGTVTEGVTFHASDALRVSRGADLRIELSSWELLADTKPVRWIGRVEGSTNILDSGNTVVERVRAGEPYCGRRGHFRFEGAYTYYLVQTGVRGEVTWHFIVDAQDPNMESVAYDFLLLQFVFGRQLRIPAFVGVREDRRAAGSRSGVGTRRILGANSFPPVPIKRNNDDHVDECWTAVLFECVSATWTKRVDLRDAFCMAFDSLLDAMTLHVNADYLRLHVGLEAFAYWLLGDTNGGEKLAVKDEQAWKAWVDVNQVAIRDLALEGLENSLVDRVRGLYRLAAGKVVPTAFSQCGLSLTPEMKKEMSGRNVVVHQGMMSRGQESVQDLDRVALVRTMLVALVARASGYEGAINGWLTGHAGYPIEPDPWWTVGDAHRRKACATFLALVPQP